MSNHPNSRRDETDRTEHGPRWEGSDNSKCCAVARSSRKRIRARHARRTAPKPETEAPNAPSDP